MIFHIWGHPMIEAMDRELFWGDLGDEAEFTSVGTTEINLGRRGVVVGDV